MQPVNPGKGEEQGLARVPLGARHRRPAQRGQTACPCSSGTRRLITRSPTSIRLARLGQDRVRGKWLALCVLFLGSAVVYGAIVGGQTAKIYDALTGGIEHLAVVSGFGVKRITVAGQLHATDASITAALGAGPDTMMLNFDTDAAKARLEAVPWIRHAQVMRLLPSTLQVVVEERTPFAVWQNKGQTYVVDAEGVVLAPALREAYASLPLVVGEGAAKSAAELVRSTRSLCRSQAEAHRRDQGRRPALDAEARFGPRDHASRRQCRRGAQLACQARCRSGGCSSGTSPPSISGCSTGSPCACATAQSATTPGGTPQAEVPTASTKVTPVKGKT